MLNASFLRQSFRGFSFANLTLKNYAFVLFSYEAGMLSIRNSLVTSGLAASLAAAGILVWFLVQRSEEPRRAYSFEIERAASLDGLDPMARQLAAVLGGATVASGAAPLSPGRPR